MFESILFSDPQAAVPGGFCPVCGSELYGPGFHCIWCERRGGDDADGTEYPL